MIMTFDFEPIVACQTQRIAVLQHSLCLPGISFLNTLDNIKHELVVSFSGLGLYG